MPGAIIPRAVHVCVYADCVRSGGVDLCVYILTSHVHLPWLHCSGGCSRLSDLHLAGGIRWFASRLTFGMLSSICTGLESSCVCSATLVPPRGANPPIPLQDERSGRGKTRMGTRS